MPSLAETIPAKDWGPRAAASAVLHPPRLRHAHEDYGLFGPGSATWEVWTYPSILIATVRAAVVQMFQPATGAGVSDRSVYQQDPLGRLRRTGDYFLTVVFGDGRTVIDASEKLKRIHDRVTGIESVSGKPYAANDPENQLWVHITTWHSVLYCYERYGPGRLSPDREEQYWHECQNAGGLQTCDPADVPTSRAGIRAYFESMRPQMCISEGPRETIRWLLAPRLAPTSSSPVLKAIDQSLVLVGRAAAATLPTYLRQLGDFDHSSIPDAAVVPLARAGSRTLNARQLQRVFAAMSPEGYAVREAALHGPTPARPETVTVRHARTAHAQHLALAAA
jgi:uncharacterized protein (DUF2236 family)